MAKSTGKRKDANPKEGKRKYGNVTFADPTNKKYPVDSPKHIRAAWSYINHKDNAARYSAEDVKSIKQRIKKAAKKQGVDIKG